LENVHLGDREVDVTITLKWIVGRWEVTGTGSGSCPMEGFDISGVWTFAFYQASKLLGQFIFTVVVSFLGYPECTPLWTLN